MLNRRARTACRSTLAWPVASHHTAPGSMLTQTLRRYRLRDLLCELHASVQALTTQLGGHHRQVIQLSGLCHNLLRLWATPVSQITRITNNALGVIF